MEDRREGLEIDIEECVRRLYPVKNEKLHHWKGELGIFF